MQVAPVRETAVMAAEDLAEAVAAGEAVAIAEVEVAAAADLAEVAAAEGDKNH
jgi:hypothetical protein